MVDSNDQEASGCGPPDVATPIRGFEPRGCHRDPAFRWYCIATEHRSEYLVLREIHDLGLPTWLPEFTTRQNPEIRPIFPRYLFVQADLSETAWRRIYSRRGVDTILGTRYERPTPVPLGVLEFLWSDCAMNGVMYPPDSRAPSRRPSIPPGTPVELAAGPLAGATGICHWSSGRRVAVLLQMFGRSVRLVVPREDIAGGAG